MHNVVENPHFANRAFQTTSGFSRLGFPNSEESKKKMSVARRGRPSGMAGKKHSDETKKRISASLKGVPCPSRATEWTEERRRKHSEMLKGRKGVHHTEETKQIIRGKLSKKVSLKSLTTGQVLHFSSQVEAHKFLGIRQGVISSVMNGRVNRVGEWAACDENGNFLVKNVSIERKTKSVRLLNVITNEVKKFTSVKEAANALGVCESTISKITRGRKLVNHVAAPEPDSEDPQ